MKKKVLSGIVVGTLCIFLGSSYPFNNAVPVQSKVIEKGALPELKLQTKDLETFKSKDLGYTKKNDEKMIRCGTNNVEVIVEEYYNQNDKTYTYVLSVNEDVTFSDSTELLPYDIINILVSAVPNEELGIYTVNASSPLAIDETQVDYNQQLFYLFTSPESLFRDEFKIELIMLNKEPFNGYQAYDKTFRLINTSSGIQIHTTITE